MVTVESATAAAKSMTGNPLRLFQSVRSEPSGHQRTAGSERQAAGHRSEWLFRKAFYLWRSATEEVADAEVPGSAERSIQLARLEAALFVAPEALSTRRLAQIAVLADVVEARRLIERLNALYDARGTAFRVERVAAGYRLMARPQFSRWLRRLHHRESQLQLSAPAMETLTVIAYRQPIKRADIDSIRGVKSAEIIKQLMERGLVKIGGDEDSLGRPYLYVTTRLFLETFGLRTLDDMPDSSELRQPQSQVHADSAPAADEIVPDDEATDPESEAADEFDEDEQEELAA